MRNELMKKTLATIMALTVVCGAQTAVKAYQPTVVITAVAADIVASGKCGENATWHLDSNGTLTISGEGKINDSYTWIDADTRKSVISIIIKEDISEISQLSYFDNLKTVSMPSDVHFISHIDGGSLLDTFFKCPKLYFGTCGEYLTWEYDEKAMNLTINGQGAMQDFQTLMAGANLVSPWLNRGYEKIANVYLSKDVTSIGKNALYGCSYENEGVSYPTITVMNSDCDVTSLASDNRDQNGKPFIYVAKIRGYENSTAHTFALENDIPFEAIDEPVVSTTTTIITTSATSTTTTSKATTTAANTTTQKPATTSTTSTTTPETTTTAEITIIASGKCGENATWQLDSEGKLTISGKGAAIEPSEWRGANPELSRDKVVSLVIEEGITELGDRMFSNFKNLESVSMPENVLFHTYDAPGTTETFQWCPKLNFGTCGKYLTWRYDTDTKSLFIDGNGPIVHCSYITMGTYAAAPWVTKNYSEYKHIYLSEGVTWFNTLAFLYCDGYGRGEKPEITILNPECDVNGLISEEDHDADGNLVKVVSKIYGYTNSTAHTFALENDIPFEAIDEPVVSTTTTIITTSATSTTTTSITTTTAANTTTTTTQIPTTTSTTSTTTTQKPTTTSTTSTTTTQKPTTASTTSTTTTQKPTTTTATSTTTAQKQTTTSTTSATTTTKPVTSSTTTVTTQPVEYELGDVNDDGKLNAVDASIVLTYYAMTSTNQNGDFTEAQKKAADLDNNGDINAVDASYILSYYAYTSTTKEDIMSIEEYMKKK